MRCLHVSTRKTFSVADFKDQVNASLADRDHIFPKDGNALWREGVMDALCFILMDTGNYNGFRYLTKNKVPEGALPGINIDPVDGKPLENFEERFSNTDPTRRFYL